MKGLWFAVSVILLVGLHVPVPVGRIASMRDFSRAVLVLELYHTGATLYRMYGAKVRQHVGNATLHIPPAPLPDEDEGQLPNYLTGVVPSRPRFRFLGEADESE